MTGALALAFAKWHALARTGGKGDCIGTLLAGRVAQQRYFSIIGRGQSVMSGVETRPERWFDGFNTVIGREQTEKINNFFKLLDKIKIYSETDLIDQIGN